jgi:hypothetical protein
MPSRSKSQARTMQAAKHNRDFANKMGIPQSMAADYVAADQAKGKKAVAKLPERKGK